MDALKRLNNEQYLAATAKMGHNLVIASAGTGKTSTIVARISYLLNSGILPERILLLTFTNKASTEMIERLQKHFDKKITSKITAGTFHSVAFEILKKLDKKIILKQPSELKSLLKSIAERRKFSHISDVKPYGGAYLYDVYSLFQNKEVDKDFVSWFCKNYEEQACYAEIYEDILKEFEEEKTKFNYADFNDILLNLKKELDSGANISYDEILVDEYQDTNSLQGALIDAFDTKSLFCVGDFDQSIYAFNGANIEIIGSFNKRYEDAKIYSLNINYRSSSSILALANKVINNNERLYEKKLIVGREGSFNPPRLLVYEELNNQYQDIAKRIQNCKTSHDEIAIIFRNNSSADGIEVALKELNISSKRKGGISFFESREIKAFIDLLAFYLNPKDIMAFIHTCEFGVGIGNSAAKDIFDALITLGKGSLKRGFLNPDNNVEIFKPKKRNYQLGLFDDFDMLENIKRFEHLNFLGNFKNHSILKYNKLNDSSAKFLYEIFLFLNDISNTQTSFDALNSIKNSTIYKIIADALATKRATLKNGKVDEAKKEDEIKKIYSKIEILFNVSKRYSDLGRFYNFLTLGSKEMSEGDGVNLLSVHASKGLEFELVYIVDLAQNRFPNAKLISMGGSLEEERRLFYVAVTRAKNELFLTYARKDKARKTDYEPSQFLKEAGII